MGKHTCLSQYECFDQVDALYMVAYGTQVVEKFDDYCCKRCATNSADRLRFDGERNVRVIEHDPVCSQFPRYTNPNI